MTPLFKPCMMELEFANPLFFWLLGLVPVCCLWYAWKNREQQATLRVSTLSRLRLKGFSRTYMRHILLVLRMTALCALIIACARPQKPSSEQIINSEGIDIMITLDVSGSMMIADVKPNRLEAAKQVADSFISKRPNDRIGLVEFAEEAFTASPVTIDHTALTQIVNAVHTLAMSKGTAIGMGLGTAINHLKESQGKSRVIILITDGENNAGSVLPLEAAQLATTFGIRVYTVGLVLDNSQSSSIETSRYLPADFKNGSDLLKRISEVTQGKFYLANDKKGLEEIFDKIDRLEKTKVDVQTYQRYTEFFFPFAFIAACFLFLEVILRFTIFKSILI